MADHPTPIASIPATAQTAAPHRLADYQPPAFLIDTLDLIFDLDPLATRVRATLSVRRNPAHANPAAPLVLDGEDLVLTALVFAAQVLIGIVRLVGALVLAAFFGSHQCHRGTRTVRLRQSVGARHSERVHDHEREHWPVADGGDILPTTSTAGDPSARTRSDRRSERPHKRRLGRHLHERCLRTVTPVGARQAPPQMTSSSPNAVLPAEGTRHALIVHTEEVMGTVVSFRVRPGPDLNPAVAKSLIHEACRRLHEADRVFSTWQHQSPLSRYRRGELQLNEAPAEVAEVLELCWYAKSLSGGFFDPWAMPGGVDPTGLVKGWAVGQATAVLANGGVEAALVNGAGDIAAYGPPETGRVWRVGIRHPWRSEALACIVPVQGARAIATSGCYERGMHLIDPRSGRPSADVASATVCGPNLALCDALATGLAVGADEGLSAITALCDYEGYIVRRDGSESWTRDMAFVE